jgi:hypothetical protein
MAAKDKVIEVHFSDMDMDIIAFDPDVSLIDLLPVGMEYLLGGKP